MVSRLRVDDDEDADDVRRGFDNEFGVVRWQVPGGGNKYADVKIEEGAPSWWVDDEEASQSALATMRKMGANV